MAVMLLLLTIVLGACAGLLFGRATVVYELAEGIRTREFVTAIAYAAIAALLIWWAIILLANQHGIAAAWASVSAVVPMLVQHTDPEKGGLVSFIVPTLAGLLAGVFGRVSAYRRKNNGSTEC